MKINDSNVSHVRLPDPPAPRICVLALDTGMRLSELLDIRVGQVKQTRGGRYIERPDSKNGHARKVVLTSRAAAMLDTLLAGLKVVQGGGSGGVPLDTLATRDCQGRRRRGLL